MDLSTLKGVFHVHLSLTDCLNCFGCVQRAGTRPDLSSMASKEWIRMVPHWDQLSSLGTCGPEPFKRCFPRAFVTQRLLELLWDYAGTWPDSTSMASNEWIRMVLHLDQLYSLGTHGSEHFKGCFPHAFVTQKLLEVLWMCPESWDMARFNLNGL